MLIRRKHKIKDLQENILILSNHGVLTCGANIPETFYYMYQLIESCKIQTKAGQRFTIPDEKIINESRKIVREIHKEGLGQKEFCAHLRQLQKMKNKFHL
jgi:ribulose-5-phosphate 4-epimerase/fuculose-1-phosphate aldolase